MAPEQRPPIRVEAQKSDTQNPATLIFLHGYDDDGEGFVNIAHQFQSANKLTHLTWIFPTAPHNHEANANAWYTPTSFSPIPVGHSSSPADEHPETDEFAEDERADSEIWDSVEYICGLIDNEIAKGVKLERILIGGFSQGCAVSLVLGLASRFKGRLGGVVGLSGYLPRSKRAWEGRETLRKELKEVGEGNGNGKGMKVFLGHGTKDMLVPMRVFRDAKSRVVYTVGEERVDAREYEGMGHVASGAEFRDVCGFLEGVVPE